uniref:Uncharacterized protein n=1 Tax=Manihot esculenta TaxID=3983 RepID=A0A199UAK9_MANES
MGKDNKAVECFPLTIFSLPCLRYCSLRVPCSPASMNIRSLFDYLFYFFFWEMEIYRLLPLSSFFPLHSLGLGLFACSYDFCPLCSFFFHFSEKTGVCFSKTNLLIIATSKMKFFFVSGNASIYCSHL